MGLFQCKAAGPKGVTHATAGGVKSNGGGDARRRLGQVKEAVCIGPDTSRDPGEKRGQPRGDPPAQMPESGQRAGCGQTLRSDGPTDPSRTATSTRREL